MQSKQWKIVSAAIGAGAVVAMGAIGSAAATPPVGTGISSGVGEMTLGETATSSKGQTKIKTPVAAPEVTAEVPDGFR